MSDRLLRVSAMKLPPVPPVPPLAALRRAVGLALRAVVRRREVTGLGKRPSDDVRLDHAPFRVPVGRLPWNGGRPPVPRGVASLRSRLRTGWRRYRSRQRIAALDAHALKDIGVTHAEAEAEANKPFWAD